MDASAAKVLLAVCLVGVLILHAKERTAGAVRRVDTVDIGQTILVLIVPPPPRTGASTASLLSRPAALASVKALYANATEPSRVNVAVYDHGDAVFPLLPPYLQPSVSVERNSGVIYKHASASEARAHLMRTCFRGERFVMTLRHDAHVVRGWDSSLVELHAMAKADAGGATLAVLTTSLAQEGPSFLAIGDVEPEKRRLLVKVKKVAKEARRPFLSLLWHPDLSFGESLSFRDEEGGGGGGGGGSAGSAGAAGDVTLTSLRLWTRGNDVFQLPCELAHTPGVAGADGAAAGADDGGGWGRRRRRRGKSVSLDKMAGTVRSVDEWHHFIGANVASGRVSARARAGLSPTPSSEEARAKAGSLEEARAAASAASAS